MTDVAGDITLEDVKRLHLEPKDIVLVHLPREVEYHVAERIKDRFREVLTNRVIVLAPDMFIEVLSPEGGEVVVRRTDTQGGQ